MITAFLATIIDWYVINLPLGVLTGLSAMSYFFVGYSIRQYGFPKILKIVSVACWLIILIYSAVKQIENPFGRFCTLNMVRCKYQLFPIDWVGAIGGTYVFYLISLKLSNIKQLSSFLTYLGQTSIAILCLHLIDQKINILRPILDKDNLLLAVAVQTIRVFLPIFLTWVCTKIELTKRIFQLGKNL